jgi:glutaredoxin
MTVSARSALGLIALIAAVGAANTWWSGRQQVALGQQVASQARPGDITMLASDTCAPCLVARRWLQAQKVPFSECSVERDHACRQQYEALGARGTPTLLVRGQVQLGFSPQQVLAGLQRGS